MFVYRHLSFEAQLVDYWWKIRISDIEILDSRRKQAADGSSQAESESLGIELDKSIQGNQNEQLIGTHSVASSSGNNKSSRAQSTLEGKSSSITKVTNVSSAVDATYGDIALGNYKLGKVALKPIVKFHQSRKLMMELKMVSFCQKKKRIGLIFN